MPFGKFEYQCLTMGLCNGPDIFQECMYVELVFSQLSEVRLKINANKSHFAVSEIEYLGYWITRDGIQPLPKKVEAIQCIAPLTT